VVEALGHAGIEARHWSTVGDGAASDREVFQWARRHDCVVLTHDLDFARILALAGGRSPSVVLLRTHRLLPGESATTLVNMLRRHATEIAKGRS
jgi:predicted nuclease of predicted toxin-antitoxin system